MNLPFLVIHLHLINISMRSRFSRPFNTDQQYTMPSGERDNSLPSTQSASSMANSNDSDGNYESAHDSEMVWEDGRERGNSVTVKSESNGVGWTTMSNAAMNSSWISPSPFVTNPASFRVPTWDSAIGNDAFTITAMPLMGIPGDPFGQISTLKQPTEIGQSAKSETETSNAVDMNGTPLPRAAALSPLTTNRVAQELDDLTGRAGQMDLGKPKPSGRGIWESLPMAVEDSSQLKQSSNAPVPATSMNDYPHARSNYFTNNATKKPPHLFSVPAGRKLSSSIHAAAAAATEKKPKKDEGIERGKRNPENKGKKEVSVGKSRGRGSGHEKQQRTSFGNRNENGWGKPDVSRSLNSSIAKADQLYYD